ncbi:hypothetical protein GGQ60_004620 [Pedobacter zeae]|uniref:Uncharacterized protein n=1 Tax=Pedobacter zeae TaxID=1737356 RepID=A0A7W6KEX3_9SPHI|nr:hypothetical protein [Pedobacter zeae]
MMFYSGEMGLKKKSADQQPVFAANPQIVFLYYGFKFAYRLPLKPVTAFKRWSLSYPSHQTSSPFITSTKSSNK